MIDTLTVEQEAMLAQVRDEWLAVGLSTEPANRPAAEEGVRQAYRRAGMEPPSVVIWLGSPYAGCVASAMLSQGQVRDQVWDQVRDQVRGQVGDQVGAQVWAQVRDQVGAQVRDQVRAQVWDQVRGQVWAQVGAQVGAQVRGQVWDQVRDQVRGHVWAQVRDAVWGQHEAGYLGWCDAMQLIGVNLDVAGLSTVARNAGWWWPMRDTVILTDRPDTLHRDPQGRLHCETGPALRYRDGWAIHAIHGVRVPADLIETGWDVKRTLEEDNAEVRRAAIELTGWDRFIADAGLTLIASAPDPGNPPHELELYDLPDRLRDMYDDQARILLCTNGSVEPDGTRRRYGLPVPAHHNDPVAAAADLYGWPAEAYRQLEVRR